jgi:fucose permease
MSDAHDRHIRGMKSEAMEMHGHSPGVVLRSLVIGLTAFLTVVDLFATQAILPSLTRHYNVTPAAMGFAVNASTMGMAVAGLVVGFFSQLIDRRLGILLSLALLAVSDHPAGGRAQSHRVHDASHRTGSMHGVGLRA